MGNGLFSDVIHLHLNAKELKSNHFRLSYIQVKDVLLCSFPTSEISKRVRQKNNGFFFFFLNVECTVVSGLIRMHEKDSQGILSVVGGVGAEPQVFL